MDRGKATMHLTTAATTTTVTKFHAGTAFRTFSVGPIPQLQFQPNATNTQTPPQQYRGPQCTDAEKLAIIAHIAPPHPDTATGWATYKAEITMWNRNNFGRAMYENRPYPLTPGTSPMVSGECFRCGHTGHSSIACTSNMRIPEPERVWHQKANSIRAGAARANNTGVNLVAEDDILVSREEYDAAIIAQYLVSQNQGNKGGPSGN